MANHPKKVKFKEWLYIVFSKFGVTVFQKLFADYFGKLPLKPTDRYIEYPFVTRNLPKPPAKVLDVGCAGSFFPLILAGFGYNVCGIDIREFAVTNRIKFDNFRFIQEDIRQASLSDNYFDAVTAVSTIEHIGIGGRYGMNDDLQGDKKTLEEIRRVLKPGGVALLTIPFGRAKIVKPYLRVYDAARLDYLAEGFVIESKEFYMEDNTTDDWVKCLESDTLLLDTKPDRYALCLVKLRKQS